MRNLMHATEDEMTAAFVAEQHFNSSRVPDVGLNENVRLLLQGFEDNGPVPQGGIYMALEGVPEIAISLGYLREILPEGSGFVNFEVTPNGRAALQAANRTLGGKATRYVHEVKCFGDLKPVCYGYPFLWPLSSPVVKIDGTYCADRRALAKTLSWLARFFR